ncbi:MAG: response regulator [Planctomycetota bacterium]
MSAPPKILIVEDDPVFRRVLEFSISKAGLSIETAVDGEAGFERLMEGGISIMVTDFQMPRCNGLELLQRLQAVEDYQRPPAILCTAKGLELNGDALRAQFNLSGILHKPFSPRKLTELIMHCLDEGGHLAGQSYSLGGDQL